MRHWVLLCICFISWANFAHTQESAISTGKFKSDLRGDLDWIEDFDLQDIEDLDDAIDDLDTYLTDRAQLIEDIIDSVEPSTVCTSATQQLVWTGTQWVCQSDEYREFETFSWSTGGWSGCNSSCQQSRTVTCRGDSTGEIVNDSTCTRTDGAKPATSQSCSGGSCPPPAPTYTWTYVSTSDRSASDIASCPNYDSSRTCPDHTCSFNYHQDGAPNCFIPGSTCVHSNGGSKVGNWRCQ